MRDIFVQVFLEIVNSSLKLYELCESCDACLINSHISADKKCSWGLIRCQNISDVYLFDKQPPTWFQLFYFICQMVVIEKGKLFVIASNITSKKIHLQR